MRTPAPAVLAAGFLVLAGERTAGADGLVPIVAPPPPLAVLSATHGGGGGVVGRAPRGPFVGADAGGAVMLARGEDPSRGAWAFGARAGYQWRSGVAFDLRFDDLGLDAPDGSGPLLVGSAGLRYGFPLVVMPYAEARLGDAFYGPHSSVAAAIALGLAVPVFRHLALDLGARDWIADLDGRVRHTPTFEVGLAVGFDGR